MKAFARSLEELKNWTKFRQQSKLPNLKDFLLAVYVWKKDPLQLTENIQEESSFFSLIAIFVRNVSVCHGTS